MQLEYKALPVSGFKVLEEDQGIIEAIVSVTGIVDRVRDNIKPGAYQKSLGQRTPKGVWGHDWNNPVSRTLKSEELPPGHKDLPKQLPDGKPWPKGAGGVKVQTQFNLETQAGRDAYSNVKFFGADQEWSIGYQVPAGAAKTDTKTGVREIEYLDWYEYSPVLFGAMPFARNLTEKSYAGENDFREPQMAFKALKDALGEEKALTYFKTEEIGVEEAANTPGEGSTTDEAIEDDLSNRGDSTEAEEVVEQHEEKMYMGNLDGSLEQRQDNIRKAVSEKFKRTGNGESAPTTDSAVDRSYYVSATFDTYVLATRYEEGNEQTYRIDYTVAEDGSVELGEPKKVRVTSTITESKVGQHLTGGDPGLVNETVESLRNTADLLARLLEDSTAEPTSATSEEKTARKKPRKRMGESQPDYEARVVAGLRRGGGNRMNRRQNWKTYEEAVDIELKDDSGTMLLDEEQIDDLASLATEVDAAFDAEDSAAATEAIEEFVTEVESLLEDYGDDEDVSSALRDIVVDMGTSLAEMDAQSESVEDEDESEEGEKVLIRLSGSDDQQEQEEESTETKALDLSGLDDLRKGMRSIR